MISYNHFSLLVHEDTLLIKTHFSSLYTRGVPNDLPSSFPLISPSLISLLTASFSGFSSLLNRQVLACSSL